MDDPDLQRALLKLIVHRTLSTGQGLDLGSLKPAGAESVATELKKRGFDREVIWADLQRASWALIARSLVWIDMLQHSPDQWRLRPTEKGEKVASDEPVNPDDPTHYMERLLRDAPSTSQTVKLYLWEALNTFNQECFLGSAVMLGVAAEASMLETAACYVTWAGAPAGRFKETLENARTFYVRKLDEFEKQLATSKSRFPEELRDNLDLDITAVVQLIRLTRNEAGHPTGRKLERQDCYNHLVVYARAHVRLHRLRLFFLDEAPSGDPAS